RRRNVVEEATPLVIGDEQGGRVPGARSHEILYDLCDDQLTQNRWRWRMLGYGQLGDNPGDCRKSTRSQVACELAEGGGCLGGSRGIVLGLGEKYERIKGTDRG